MEPSIRMVPSTGAGESAAAHGLVARDAELALFDAVLARRRPCVLLVKGEAGMGKTALLEAMQARAAGQGWHIVPSERVEKLSVAPGTTHETFSRRTRELLGLAAPGDDTAGAIAPLDCTRRTVHPLVAEFQRRAPMLVLVDGCHATPAFTDWLAMVLIPEIKAGDAAVVLVLAEREGHFAILDRFADERIVLGPLDEAALKTLLTATSARLTPPMEADELGAYVAELTHRPDLLGSLLDVLALAEK